MAASKKLSKAHYENLAGFRYALRRFLRFSQEAAKRAGVTPQQHQALLAIKGFPGRDIVTVGELAERLQLRHHSAVELLDRLMDLNLVVRQRSTVDRRRVQVRLTERGERILGELSAAHDEQLRRLGPELSAALRQLGDHNRN
jgi:DNA-binding MarR family transcriptional regulator